MRHPAGLDYPQPTGLHMETYIRSLQWKLTVSTRPRSHPADCPGHFGHPGCKEASPRPRWNRDQADGAGTQWPRLRASISPEIWPIRHERSQCGQACPAGLFRTPLPRGPGPVLPQGGAPSGNAWRRSASAGSSSARGLSASSMASRCSSRAGWAQAARNRVGGCASGRSRHHPQTVSVLVKDPSPGLGSRSAIALVSRSR